MLLYPTAPTPMLNAAAFSARRLVVLLWFLCGTCGCALDQQVEFPGTVLDELALPTMKEPSGICYHTARKTLFVVDDGGDVCEAALDGRIMQQRHVRDADLEGITTDPSTGLLYVAIEGRESILEIEPVSLQPLREFFLPRTWKGATVMKEGGQGLEGLVFVPDTRHRQGGTFFVSNQAMALDEKDDISAIFEVELPLRVSNGIARDSAILTRLITPGATDIAALYYDAQGDLLFAVSDAENLLIAFSRDGTRRGSWPLPGDEQEGFAVDAAGTGYIAQDTGGVLRVTLDWRALREKH